jgi:hypothetical protein
VSQLENCWGSVVVSCCCEELVGEAEEEERPPLEADMKQRLVKTVTD